MPTRRTAVLALVLISLVAGAGRAAAAPGDLDPTFGGDGTVEAYPGGYISVPTSVVVQADGGIVAAGVYGPTNSDVALVRWESDGDLDLTFDGDGIITTDFGADEIARAVAVQWDGKIVIAGATGFSYGMDGDVILARYLADGSLDPDFGVGGKVTTNLGLREGAGDVAILGDERIVVAAFGYDDQGTGATSLIVIRYLADGTPDPTFGTGGAAITPIAALNTALARLVVQPDGKVVAATFAQGTNAFVAIRYDTDGDLDGSFGDDGIATAPIVNGQSLSDLVRLPGDALVVSGSYYDNGANRQNAVLVKLESDGDVDESFADDGYLFGSLAPGANDRFESLLRQPDDKLVAAGTRLWRWDLDGVPDVTFGSGGVASGGGAAITQQSDGKLVKADASCVTPPFCEPGLPCPPSCHFGAARYLNDSPPVTPAPTATPMPTTTPACPMVPAAGCATPASKGAQLMLTQPSDPAGRRLEWKWKKGSATTFGDPTTTSGYSVCVYDAGTLVTTAFAEPAGTCNVAKPSPCWRGMGNPPGSKGYQYRDRDRDRAFDGLTKIQLKPHPTAGKASIAVSARGAALDLTALPASPPVVVQLHDGSGTCFSATYSTNVSTSTSTLFKAKSD